MGDQTTKSSLLIYQDYQTNPTLQLTHSINPSKHSIPSTCTSPPSPPSAFSLLPPPLSPARLQSRTTALKTSTSPSPAPTNPTPSKSSPPTEATTASNSKAKATATA